MKIRIIAMTTTLALSGPGICARVRLREARELSAGGPQRATVAAGTQLARRPSTSRAPRRGQFIGERVAGVEAEHVEQCPMCGALVDRRDCRRVPISRSVPHSIDCGQPN
jgi:hypothetical protein